MVKRRAGQGQDETAADFGAPRDGRDDGLRRASGRENETPDKVQLRDNVGVSGAGADQLPFFSQTHSMALRLGEHPREIVRGDTSRNSRSPTQPLSKAGHRDRLRKRFREGGADALPDYELLELVLFRAIPRRDTKDLSKRLLLKFGSFADVVNATAKRLKEVTGVGDSVVTELKLVNAAALRMMKSQLSDKPVLSTWDSVLQYVRAAQAYEDTELFRILFLDKRNRLIGDEVQGRGTVDHTPVYIREVVKRALELSSTAIILVHNHPSGDPSPSRADIEMTRLICAAAKPLGITVHDHIIVGREGHASLKALKLM